MHDNAHSINFETIVQQITERVANLLSISAVSIYLLEKSNIFSNFYSNVLSDESSRSLKPEGDMWIIKEVAESKSCKIIEMQNDGMIEVNRYKNIFEYSSIAYVPIIDIHWGIFGVAVLWYKKYGHITECMDGILELIGHHIGIAIENINLLKKYSKSKDRYRILFNNIPHSIFLLNGKDFSIIDSNLRAQSAYGYTKEEFIGMPFLDLSGEEDEELLTGLKNISENQYCRIAKKQFYPKNMQPFYVNVNISAAKYDEDDVIIVSTTDITKSVEKETQLIQTGKMTTLGLMAAGMAHEINQPLNVIQVCADYFNKMLNRKQPIPENDLVSMTKEIVSSVRRISETIRHVRDFSRQSAAAKSKIDINNPIRDAFRIIDYKIESHKILTELELEPSLPSILADHNRLEQVFINLLNNSIDAIEKKCRQGSNDKTERRITVKSFVEKGFVVVTITDTGIGMSGSVKKKIFEPFFTTKHPGKGTGLGASTSYGIIKDYDGYITFESEEGNGTTFEIKFPAMSV